MATTAGARTARFARGTLLRDAFPQLLLMLHPRRNSGVDLETLTAGNGGKIWWKCPAGDDHEWLAVVNNMTRPNSRCPFCAGRRVSHTNSLADCYPDVAAEWHPMANATLRPELVVFGSNRRAWWQCTTDERHQWEAQIYSRTTGRRQCPFCTNKRVSPTNNLAVCFPPVAAQWHPSRNGSLTPADVPFGSGKEVWWVCPAGPDHQWSTRVVERTTYGYGCPFCARQRPSVTNSLATLFPEVAAQLDPERNGAVTAEQVIAGSNTHLWWRCLAGPDHVWRAMPRERVHKTRPTGCPACSGNQVSVTNSLASLFPGVAAEWHPTENGGLTPDDVTAYSNKAARWRCLVDPGHVWDVSPGSRNSGNTGCPSCSNRRVSPTNNLAVLHPHLAAQFDPALNGGLTADKVVAGSGILATWRCQRGPDHTWQRPVRDRTARDAGCPACNDRSLSVTNSLVTRFPEVAADWHPTRNGDLTPDQVIGVSSVVRAWWACDRGSDHEWETSVHQRTVVGTTCPSCSGSQLSVTNSLATRFAHLAQQWHPTRNGDLTPDKIVSGSTTRVWWKCPEGPDHEWSVSVEKRTGQDSTGCPACSGRQLSVTNSLATRFPHVAVELDPLLNDGRTADRIIAGSDERLWWRCPAGPDHIWDAIVSSRTLGGSGCACCAGFRVSVTNSLATRFPEIAAELDPELNDGLTADQVTAGSSQRIEWRCRKDPAHTWTTRIGNRTAGDTNCPVCAISGFDPSRPAYLYLLRRVFDGREQRKIGITHVPRDRLTKLRRFEWQAIEVSSVLDGAQAREREHAFLAVLVARGLRKGRSNPHPTREDGYTEAWDHHDLPVDSLTDVANVVAGIF